MARILVIDDQAAILKILESILSRHGHVITTAVDGLDGLEKFAQFPFELVITDAVMPGGVSGYDVVRTIRSTHAEIPVILLTGRREKRDVERAIEAGVDDYVVKPVDPDLFVAKVDSLLKKTNPTSAGFTEVSASSEASLYLALRVTGVSEVGLTLQSPYPIPSGSKIEIASSFFKNVGMASPRLRVVSCDANSTSDLNAGYKIRVQFFGITEASLQPLRLWIRNQGRSLAG